jgi:hypothetical protein
MNALMSTARARTKTFLTGSAIVMLLLIMATAVLVGQGIANITRTQSDQQAAKAVDLLGTVGADFPNLTPSALAHGLSPVAGQQLDMMARRVQHDGLLANIVIWDRSGRILYSSVQAAEGTRPPEQAELATAVAGHPVTQTHKGELDPSSGKRTGVLDALQPLFSNRGVVYAVLEVSLPLKAVQAAATRAQDRGVLIVLGGAALLCMFMLPLWVRLARSQANDWIPGRRGTLRAIREALKLGAIELVYQPQIEPASRRVEGVEALIRWRRNGELVGPDRFLAAAESSALMPRLTDRVIDLAPLGR